MNRGKYISEDSRIIEQDITLTPPDSLGIEDIHFIIGGPPCQSFSAAGRRAGGVYGINDTRGSLFWHYCQYLKYFQPKGFLFENVKGILQANNRGDWKIIMASFEEAGYTLKYQVLDAADYGTPQHRERVILVGIRKDINVEFFFPAPTHGISNYAAQPYATPESALADMYDPDEHVPPYGGKYGHLLPEIPPGRNYLHFTERMGHPSPLFAWRSKFSGFLYKLPMDHPSKTIVANQGRYDGPFHWNNRKLTIPELKRLQGFPDDYSMVDSIGEATRQIGNSVAPLMAHKLAEAVQSQIFGHKHVNVALSFDDDIGHHSRRKAVKSANTKRAVAKRKPFARGQGDLFLEKPIFTDQRKIQKTIVTPLGSFNMGASLAAGRWDLEFRNESSQDGILVRIDLFFDLLNACKFNRICVDGRLVSIAEIGFLWDAIHYLVAESSSYEDLMPLYGHFTEPYPKFTINHEIKLPNDSDVKQLRMKDLLQHMADFDFLSKIHLYSDFFDSTEQAVELIKELRCYGYDIRTHVTNRGIKDGYFQPCYPFSLYSSNRRFTVWREKGSHATGDIEANLEDGQLTGFKARK
jgi:DNA (cytosine-5)-methyltransferase 1